MKRNGGMMTIEATVIVPITLIVTILIFWTGILLYDRAAVRSAVSIAALRGSERAELGNEELADLMSDVLKDYLDKRLVMMEEPQADITVEYGKIRVSVSGEVEVPELPLYGSAIWEVSASAEALRLRESQIVRTIHRIDRVMEERKGEE